MISSNRNIRLTVAANFVADPIAESLEYWLHKNQMPISINFAPYDRLIQQLFDPVGPLSASTDYTLLLLQMERWILDGNVTDPPKMQNFEDFADALTVATLASSTRFIVIICPSSPDVSARNDIRAIGATLVKRLSELPGVDVIGDVDMDTVFPTTVAAAYFDAHLGETAQIPYTRLGFALLGTVAARRLRALATPPRKAIVVDCDNTLWSGLCGEVPVLELRIGAGRRTLQEFLLRQHEAGKLLLIASKNDLPNVFAVLDNHPEMLLKREHFCTWRIDWKAKPDNVLSMARELGLGLDSFAFIDDDSYECGAMQATCPEVLTLQLPTEESEIDAFLRSIWEFDLGRPTTDDRRRNKYYAQHAERIRHLRETSPAKFLATLALHVDIVQLNADGLARAAQLTERINQFNLNGIRRSEGDLRHGLGDPARISFLLSAHDRFGDYGNVGLVLASTHLNVLCVETLVLSCRALGKGIEQILAGHLAQVANAIGVGSIDFLHRTTAKNGPFRTFLSDLGVVAVGDRWSVTVEKILPSAVPSQIATDL